MLLSKKLELRRSEIRQELATLAANESPSEEETRKMSELDTEYRQAEQRYRAALVSEDEERREAEEELETREGKEWDKLVSDFEIRQVVAALDEGHGLTGQTQECVSELRTRHGFQGVPIPYGALATEVRAGETVSTGVVDPVKTRPIVDQLFPDSIAAKMGVQRLVFDHGEQEIPVTTQGVSTGWQDGELADGPAPQAFQTTDRSLAPDHTLIARMVVSRKSLKQAGAQLEQAIKRDANSAIGVAVDTAIFQGTGANGQPTGIVANAGGYAIDINDVSAAASYSAFRAAGVEFLSRNAASSFKDIRLMMRHELINTLDGAIIEVGSGITEYDFVAKRFGNVYTTGHALSAPSGSPAESSALMTTVVGGVSPAVAGFYGAVDAIRDPFTAAASGQLKITFLVTMDVTVIRPAQLQIVTGLQ